MNRFSFIILAVAAAPASSSVGADKAPESLTFEEHVRPLFKANCFDCHGEGETLKGKLDLRLKRFAERGGESGKAIVPGQPGESLLWKKIQSGD